MFGLGFGEIIVVLVVALLVLGPEGLPKAARTIGRFMGELRRTGDELRAELLEEIDEDLPRHSVNSVNRDED